MMSQQEHYHQAQYHIPATITDPQSNQTYQKGKFLGKGAFARCYELKNMSDQKLFAAKVIWKRLLDKPRQREKLAQEIRINRMVCNPYIVNMYTCFEDEINVYMLLELCTQKSLLELQKRRKKITEPEARYFIKQITHGCEYMHDKRIIHRDLKLANIFLNDQMNLKIGDFGFSAILDNDSDRRQTLCGTPNYVAPEVITNIGHTFAVDIWAIGCILYTLIVGSPPFSSDTVLKTYQKIKYHEYSIPKSVSVQAFQLIAALLNRDASLRPIAKQIQKYAFFEGYTPSHLPITCLVSAPNYPSGYVTTADTAERVAFSDNTALRPYKLNYKVNSSTSRSFGSISTMEASGRSTGALEDMHSGIVVPPNDHLSAKFYLSELLQRIGELLVSCKPNIRTSIDDSFEDPSCEPIYWIVKWVDYLDKCGLAYTLPDKSEAVKFNDQTSLIMHGNGTQLQYIDRKGQESFFTVNSCPEQLQMKMNMLTDFRNMCDKLRVTGECVPHQSDELARVPIILAWVRSLGSITFLLSNGTVQINFFADHTKLIICSRMDVVTYFDRKGVKHVMKMQTLANKGVSAKIYHRLEYAQNVLKKLLAKKPNFQEPLPLPEVSVPDNAEKKID